MEQSKPNEEIAKDILALANISTDFARVERAPHYPDGRRETDVEHSYMLGLIAVGLARQYWPELDSGAVAEFSYIHDLVELRIGDTATFHAHKDELAEKQQLEAIALVELREELTEWPAIYELLKSYEEQKLPEARFVKIVDKMMPALVNIINGGFTLREDYVVQTLDDLMEGKERRRKRLAEYEEDMAEAISLKDAVSELMYSTLFDEDGQYRR